MTEIKIKATKRGYEISKDNRLLQIINFIDFESSIDCEKWACRIADYYRRNFAQFN